MIELKIKDCDKDRMFIEEGKYAVCLLGIDDQESETLITGNINPKRIIPHLVSFIDKLFLGLSHGNEQEAQFMKMVFTIAFTDYQIKKLEKEAPED